MYIVMWVAVLFGSLIVFGWAFFTIQKRILKARDEEIIYTSFPMTGKKLSTDQVHLLAKARWPGITRVRIIDALYRFGRAGRLHCTRPDDLGQWVGGEDALWYAVVD